MQRAKHIILFGRIYSDTPCRNVVGSIYICISNITAIYTGKLLAFSKRVFFRSDMFAHATSLTCISGRDNNQFNAIKQRLVSQKLTKLVKTPTIQFCLLCLTLWLCSKSNFTQIFNSNALVFLFGFNHYLFANCMVINQNEPAFSTTKPFQEFFSSFSAFALNACSYFRIFFTNFFKLFRIIISAIRKNGNVCLSKIHTDKFLNLFNIFFWNINGLKKVKLPFLVNQICFTFNVRQVVSIMANKGNFNPATDSPKGNNIVRLVGHNPTVITYTSKWSKFSFSFLVKFVSIGNFCNTSYKNLTAKFKRSFIGVVNFVMKFKIIENTLFPSHIRNGITNSISLLHRFEKQISLFISRQKFYFQCKFHEAKILNNFIYQKIITNFVKQFNYGAAIPPIGSKADQWVSLPKTL